jgi:hypothetical protein
MTEETLNTIIGLIFLTIFVVGMYTITRIKCRYCKKELTEWRGADVCANKQCKDYGLL